MRWGWLAGLPGWVLGVALQLQQAELWPMEAYAALLCAGLLLAGGARKLRPEWLCFMLAGTLIAVGLTGARAAQFAGQALDPALEGADLAVTGRIASLPQRLVQGQRFEFIVETARRADGAVTLPERIQLGWYAGLSPAAQESLWEMSPVAPVLRAGDRWHFTVRLRRPHGLSNPHGFDRERCSVGSFV